VLIAETGGQNVLIVDSSSLPEQVVADALTSAFDSAGQRCSALRVMCVQDDVADKVVHMVEGALAELQVGDPARLETDVGPVIDAEAQQAIEAHLAAMRVRGTVHALAAERDASGTFCLPSVVAINALSDLKREVFGPVLHVLRYQRTDLDTLIDEINALGYGLTLGVHSRIDETIEFIVARAHVGNIYVNRNMIGAVVGVQPFGGEGLSGTGPKAGGPLYVERLRHLHSAAIDITTIDAQGRVPCELPALDALRDWARQRANARLVQRCVDHAAASPLGFAIELPGPTGETNRETFHPRGRVLCEAQDEAGLLDQVAAVFATGNRAVVAASAQKHLPSDLPPGVRVSIEPIAASTAADVDLALCSDPAAAARLRRELAAREGPRARVVTPVDGAYPLLALVVERVLSVNTAAAGGNASLMTLEL